MPPAPEGWIYKISSLTGNEPLGYFSDQEILREVEEGRLKEDSIVWHARHTKGDWLPAAKIKAFQARFEQGRRYLAAKEAERAARIQADIEAAKRVMREREEEKSHVAPPPATENMIAKARKWLFSPPHAPRPVREAIGEVLWRGWPIVALFAGLFGLLIGSTSSFLAPSWWSLLCYPMIVVIGAALIAVVISPFRRRWLTLAAWGLVICWLGYWAAYDTYTIRWSGERADYVDRYHRWTGRHLERTVDIYSVVGYEHDANGVLKPKLERRITESGPMSSSGKPHGRWQRIRWRPDFDISTVHYWYGEEVPEGTWMLRNK